MSPTGQKPDPAKVAPSASHKKNGHPNAAAKAQHSKEVQAVNSKFTEEGNQLKKARDAQIKAQTEVLKSKFTSDRKTMEARQKQELKALRG